MGAASSLHSSAAGIFNDFMTVSGLSDRIVR